MKSLIATLIALASFVILSFTSRDNVSACSRGTEINMAVTCQIAEFIVVAKAVKYSQPPRNQKIITTGVPDSKIVFNIEEILKGDSSLRSLELNGYLSDKDEFNDQPVPYNFVRPSGRRGSCYANTYKQGALFLLFGRKLTSTDNGYTVNIDPLAPVNEQLHSQDDPWVYYIKGVLKGLQSSEKPSKNR